MMFRNVASWVIRRKPTLQGKPLPPELPLPKVPALGHLPYLLAGMAGQPRLGRLAAKMGKMTKSPIYRAKVGSLPVVILNDAKSIRKVFGSDVCNGRRKMLFSDVYFPDSITMSSGKRFEMLKTSIVGSLKEFGTSHPDFESVLDEEIGKLMRPVMAVDGQEKAGIVDFKHYTHGYCMNAVMWIVARHTFDITSKEFEEFVSTVLEVLGRGGYIAFHDLFPTLPSMIPGWLSGMDAAKKRKDVIYDFLLPPVQKALSFREPGKPRHLLDKLVDDTLGKERKNFTELEIRKEVMPTVADLVCSAESAGSALSWTLLNLASHPFDQKRIQDEIAHLDLKDNATPSYDEHHEQMPYTMAALHESLRLACPAPLGFAHNAETEAIFDDFAIPKDTAILANFSRCHHDGKLWSNPEEFRPNRFLDEKSKEDKLKTDLEGFMPFSVGKRSCPGEPLAWRLLFRSVCGILKNFDLAAEDWKYAIEPNKTLPFIRVPSHNRMTVQTRVDKK